MDVAHGALWTLETISSGMETIDLGWRRFFRRDADSKKSRTPGECSPAMDMPYPGERRTHQNKGQRSSVDADDPDALPGF